MVYASVAHLWIFKFMVEIVNTFCFSVQQFCFRNQHFIHWIHWHIYSDHAIAMIRIVFNPSWWKLPSCLGWKYLLPPKSQEFSKFVHHRPLRKKTSANFLGSVFAVSRLFRISFPNEFPPYFCAAHVSWWICTYQLGGSPKFSGGSSPCLSITVVYIIFAYFPHHIGINDRFPMICSYIFPCFFPK